MAQVIHISEENVRDAWLNALTQVFYSGDKIKTEYDKSNDPPSRDATVLIEIKNPSSEPIRRRDKIMRIKSKYGNSYEVWGSIADTYLIGSIKSGYIEEIMEGVNDHLIWDSGTSFPYSYHDRIYNYSPYSLEDTLHVNYNLDIVKNNFVKNHKKLKENNKIDNKDDALIWNLKENAKYFLDRSISEQVGLEKIAMGVLEFPRINQIEYIINKLKEKPYSRRAQAITWRPLVDPFHIDPPCLQRIYMRVKNERLLMQTTWRSRDLFRAWEANVNGMIRIQKQVAEALNVEIGHYLDFSNSLHIYGNTIQEVEDLLKRMVTKNEKFPDKARELLEKNGLL